MIDKLKAIGLLAVADEFEDLVAHATKNRLGSVEILERICDLELRERTRKSLERRLSRSKIGHFKHMSEFDWAWPKKYDRTLIESCLNLDFLTPARNVVLVAPHGLGKTMIAKNIAHNAVIKGYTVSFLTASQLLLDLGSRDSARALENRLKYYAKQGLLVLDELGYLAYDNHAADLLFQLVNRRYEKKSIVITTNLAFSDWTSIFPSATSATALIDRFVHHADIIPLEGTSFRMRDAQEDTVKRRIQRRSTGPQKRAST